MLKMVVFLLMLVKAEAFAAPTWQKNELIPTTGRANPYEWSQDQWGPAIWRGKIHALVYPVAVTGALLPYEPIARFLESRQTNPLREFLRQLSFNFSKIHSFDEAMQWLGLHPYPPDAGQPSSSIPLPEGMKVGEGMGLTKKRVGQSTGFTISCAACHVGHLFGQPIIGLSNRFPRANALFIQGKTMTELVSAQMFKWTTDATSEEALLYKRTAKNMRFVDSKRPEILGLDTSLAHVALSLARREKDQDASKNLNKAYAPDWEPLKWLPSDSKPAVWWNLKYKNRWLSDGSVVSGNPIVTNLLWNEIGRGSDLVELNEWLKANEEKIKDLTTAVFAAEAPRITDFFTVDKIDIEGAKRGEIYFKQLCSKCHGTYVKGWSRDGAQPIVEQLRTINVIYHQQTPVIDVGTDASRREGMASLVQLNNLAISKENGVQIEVQHGYVPPPLVGIWARWPYLHNNSVPNLCVLLTRGSDRPVVYWSGEAKNKETDFDFACNGYPIGKNAPPHWQEDLSHKYNTQKKGLSRLGHDEGIFLKNGQEVLSSQEKMDLIKFLQTL